MKLLRKLFRRGPDWATLGASYDSARYIMERKGADMALYLRERRDPTGLKAFHRKRYFQQRGVK